MKKINTIIKKFAPYFFLLLPFLNIGKHLDNDFWFTANHGRYILENGFTNIEPFTIHCGLTFSFEKWLTSVIFYSIYDKLGVKGMMILLYVVGALILFIFYKAIMLVTEQNKRISIIFTVLFSSTFFGHFIVTRPQIFSYLILILEFFLCEKYIKTSKWQFLIALPFLSCLFMQLHSTMWPMFFIVLMPYLFDFKKIASINFLNVEKEASNYKKIPLYIFTFISITSLFINPYGYKSVIYFFNSLGVNNLSLINELQKTTVFSFVYYGIVPLIALLFYLIKRAYKQIPLRYLYFYIGTLLLSTYALRNTAYFAIFGTLTIVYLYKDNEVILGDRSKTIINSLASFVLLVFILIAFSTPVKEFKNTYGYSALIEFNEKYTGNYEENQNIKLYTSFNTGSYAEWLGYKTYIDPRAEVFLEKINNKEDIIQEFKKLISGKIHYKDIQEKYDFDYWLVENGNLVENYISRDNDYKLLFEKDSYSIYKYIKDDSASDN